MSYTIRLHNYKGDVLREEQEIFSKEFLERFLMTLMKLRLGFLFTDLSQYFGVYLIAFALKFFLNKR